MPSLPVSRRQALVVAAPRSRCSPSPGARSRGAGAAAEQPAPGARAEPPPRHRRARRPRRRRRPAARASTGWRRASASPTPSPARAERPRRPTPPRSISPRRSPTGYRCSCRAESRARRAAGPNRSGGRVSLSSATLGRARRAARCRARDRPEDPRLPRRARRLPLRRRSRRDPRHRPRPDRAAARPGVAVIARALADAPRRRGLPRPGARERGRARRRSLSRRSSRLRSSRRAVARRRGCRPARSRSLLAGWWWGSARLDAFDRQPAGARGRHARPPSRSSSPARSGEPTFALRVPAEVRRFGERSLRERVLLELPVGRSPPQGAVLELPRDGAPRRAAPRTASTSAAGSHAAASTSCSAAATGESSAGAAASAASPTGFARMSRARSLLGSTASGARSWPGSCSARTRGCPTSSATASRPRASTTCWPCRARTSPSSRCGVLGLAWLLGIPRLAAEVRRDRGDRAATCSPSAGSPRSSAPESPAALASLAWLLSRPRDRWHFLALGAAVLLAWTPASLLEPGFQLSFAAVGSIFLLVPRLRPALEGYPLPAWLARCARGLDRLRRRDGADPLAPVRQRPALLAARRTRSSRSAIGPLLGLALVGSLVEPVLPAGSARARAGSTAGSRPTSPPARALSAGLPFAQVGSGAAVCVLLGAPLALLACSGCRAGGGRRAIACAAALAARRSLAWQLLPAERACRRRPACGSPSSTSARATRSCSRCPRGGARRPGPARGGRRPPAARPRRPPARRARAHAPAARPHRRRGGLSCAASPSTASSIRGSPSPARSSGPRSPRRPDRGVPVVETRAGRRVPARPAPASCSLARPAGNRERRSEPAPGRPARELRRDRRAADGRRRDGGDGAAALAADRDPQGRAPRLGRPRARCRAARAATRGRRHLLRPRQRLRPSDAVDACRASGRARVCASTGPTRTGGSCSSRTGGGSRCGPDR